MGQSEAGRWQGHSAAATQAHVSTMMMATSRRRSVARGMESGGQPAQLGGGTEWGRAGDVAPANAATADSGPAPGSHPLHHLSRRLDSKGSFLRRVFLFLFF